jgi:heme A synthase
MPVSPLTIIVLIPRSNPAWIVALHRFIEVSVGIIVALLVVAIWRERSAIAAKNADLITRSGGALSQRFETRIVTQRIKHRIEFE